MTSVEFRPWPKIPRLFREVVITEKIDGTNGCIIITEDGKIAAQSRNRLITPDDDNYGFAAWVWDNHPTLINDLGPGYHFGEWWGHKIGRSYGRDERYFSLFNLARWHDAAFTTPNLGVVPVLYQGAFSTVVVDHFITALRHAGSKLDHNTRSEGVVVYHTASRQVFKVTVEDDAMSKGEAESLKSSAPFTYI